MVATAGGSGVAGASNSMKIKGSLDTSDIDRGFTRVKQGFDNTKGKAKSFGADMQRVSNTVSGLAKKLMFMGVAGGSALVGLASKSPAVAPAIAKMSVTMDKMKRSLGEALAPAFEKVAGGLDKLATWIDNNKEKLTEVSLKFLDWAVAVGEKLWPWLEKIGTWASNNPGLFASIIAGLVIGPSVISGIASITGLITTMVGATISASVLAALGYLALIAAAGYIAFKGAEFVVDKLQTYTGMGTDPEAPTDMSGQTLLNRVQQKTYADLTGQQPPWEDQLNINSPAFFKAEEEIRRGGHQPTPEGMMSAGEARRAWYLQWMDSVWG